MYHPSIQAEKILEFLLFLPKFYKTRFPKIGIISIHYRSIGKGCPVKDCYSMLRVYMSEKMQPGTDNRNTAKKFFRAVIDIVVKIKDAQWRRVGNENVRTVGDICIMLGLAAGYAVAHKHRDSIESHTADFHTGIAQVMHVIVESVNLGTIKAFVVVAADEYLLQIRKVAEPVQEIQCFLLAAVHCKIAGMHHDIGLGQIAQPPVAAVRVGNMQYFHLECFLCRQR